MIDSCNPTIATWNDEGSSFIIHDVATFADVSNNENWTAVFCVEHALSDSDCFTDRHNGSHSRQSLSCSTSLEAFATHCIFTRRHTSLYDLKKLCLTTMSFMLQTFRTP